jgi:hypothetical protein
MAKIIPIDGGIRLPGPRDRVTIVGRTGSGKTQAGVWHLSNASFDARPWIIVDPKRDDTVAKIEGAEEIELTDKKLPTHPGIYTVHPLPHQADELDAFFMRVWERENIGLYCDEGYMCADGSGFLACLTQGRSKRIPMIILSQRPVSVSRFCFSEASFFQCFHLNDKRDKQTVRNFAPIPETGMPDFWSWYYDVSKNKMYKLKPVPSADVTLEYIITKLDARPPRKRYL